MTQEEAQVIAHLAESQFGAKVAIRCEGDTWIALITLHERVERIASGTEYMAWRARMAPVPSRAERRRTGLLAVPRVIGWLLSGFLALVTQAISALSPQDKSGGEAVFDMDSAYTQEVERGYGYRVTHPPDSRQ